MENIIWSKLAKIDTKEIKEVWKIVLKERFVTLNPRDIFPSFFKNRLPISFEEYLSLENGKPYFRDDPMFHHIYNVLRFLKIMYDFNKDTEPNEVTEYYFKYLSRLEDWIKRSSKIFPEDSEKRNILLILPSDKQFKKVRGRWDKWVWRRKTVYNEDTPTFTGWMNDILNLADTLKREGVNPVIAVDIEGYKYVEEVYSGRLIDIDLPENLPKMGYPRDQSVTWFREPIIGSMSLNIRRGEEKFIIKIYRKLNVEPIYMVGITPYLNKYVLSKMEGGNFILISSDNGNYLFTGVGVRGSNTSTFQNLSQILPKDIKIIGVPLSSYITDWVSGAVHLDVVMMYLGRHEGTVLIDPSRMGIYSFIEYDRERGKFILRNGFEVFHEIGLKVLEPPKSEESKITMVNALNLGRNKLVVDSYNRSINRFLSRLGMDVIEVDIPHIEAGGGGVRCATREIWI